MVRIYNGLEEIVGSDSLQLPIDAERVGGEPINIFNFPKYLERFRFHYKIGDWTFSDLKRQEIEKLTDEQIKEIQENLLKRQLEFAYKTTPSIYYMWGHIYSISPDHIKNFEDFQKIPPITKKHQRLLGWQNFLPAPIADFYLNGVPKGRSIDEIDPNLLITQEKWTGGTTAKAGRDYVQIIIPEADWRASVDTMERILYPVKDIVEGINMAVTTYDMRHIARPIFEAQLRRYGKHLLAVPPGASDDAWIWQIRNLGAQGGVASPADQPLKGIGWPGMLYGIGNQFGLALMSSTVPERELLIKMLEHNMAVLNVGGDTASLPTYHSLVGPKDYNANTIKDALNKIEKLKVIQIAPAYTEIVNPVDLSFSREDEEGVLLQTNYASVWVDRETGESYIVPALKSQMVRSSATGNLVKVMGINNLGRPNTFNHQILRYNDFRLDEKLMPIYENPHSSGGSSKGGCAG